jgi:hypothetical protein
MPRRGCHHADIATPTPGKRGTQRILEVDVACLEVWRIGIGDIGSQKFLPIGQHAECGALDCDLVVNPVDHDIGRKMLK